MTVSFTIALLAITIFLVIIVVMTASYIKELRREIEDLKTECSELRIDNDKHVAQFKKMDAANRIKEKVLKKK